MFNHKYDNVIDMDMKKGNKIMRQAKVIGTIVAESSKLVVADDKTHTLAGAVGLYQGLKYKGSFKTGIKGGLAVYGVLIAANSIQNIVHNFDVIKDA